MNSGWIKIHRKIIEWEWFQDHNTFRVFVYLLLTANHEEKKWQGHLVKPGQKITSYQHLAQETGLTVRSIRTALTKLKATGELTHAGTSKYSLITLSNWSSYQTSDKPPDKRATRERHATDNQTTTNKNDKNVKNEKNHYGEFGNVLLTDDEHSKLIERYGRSAINTLIEELSTYQKSSGRLYKDHYATLLNWAKRKNVVEVRRQAPPPAQEAKPLTPEEIERNKTMRADISTMLHARNFKNNQPTA